MGLPLLLSMAVALGGPSPPDAAPGRIDCGRAEGSAQTLVCGDAELTALDAALAAEFDAVLAAPGADRRTLALEQSGWARGRDDCWKATDPRACVWEAYQTRRVDLKIQHGSLVVPTPVAYACEPGDKPFAITYYDAIEPRAAVVTWGDDQAIAFARPTASGTLYTRDGLSVREHQGVVDVDFWGNALRCRAAAPQGAEKGPGNTPFGNGEPASRFLR